MTHERWTDSPLDPRRRMPPLFRPLGAVERARGIARYLSHPRRLLCMAVVLGALASGFLGGCASFETTRPASEYGSASISWRFNYPGPFEHGGDCATVVIGPGVFILRFKGPPRTFRDSMECLGHELLHVMGARHAE